MVDLEQRAFQGNQAGGKVAAIDSRYVAWLQGRQIVDAVPVQKMSSVALESFQALERVTQTRYQGREAHVAQIVSRYRCEQH